MKKLVMLTVLICLASCGTKINYKKAYNATQERLDEATQVNQILLRANYKATDIIYYMAENSTPDRKAVIKVFDIMAIDRRKTLDSAVVRIDEYNRTID